MDLIDKINDEKTGGALLYCFTKGYGSVPMNVYNIVLPLLTNEIFQEELKKETDFQKCVNACIQKDNDFVKKVTEKISEYEEMTSRFLAILLVSTDNLLIFLNSFSNCSSSIRSRASCQGANSSSNFCRFFSSLRCFRQ